MSKPQSLNGSINLTKLIQLGKQGKLNSTRVQTKNDGECIFVNINVWIKDEADQYNQNASIEAIRPTDHEPAMPRNYVGNMKFMQIKEAPAATPTDFEDDDDLPF